MNKHSNTNIHTHLPVEEGGEYEHADNAEGQDVDDVGQEHLPFTVQTILTLLVTDSPQGRDYTHTHTQDRAEGYFTLTGA